MNTIYMQSQHGPGYGPRIYVPYETLGGLWNSNPTDAQQRLVAMLNALSTWQGSDKDTGKAKGWEFPSMDPRRFEEAVDRAKALGFEVVEATAENAHEFWR